MSCGPSKALASLAEKVDLANEKIDELILQPTIGKLDDIKQQAEDELNGVLGDLEEMIPEINLGIEIPEELKSLQDDFKDVGNFLLLGLAKKDALVSKMKQIESKWSSVDLGDFKDLNDVSKALMSGAADLDALCKLLPNAQIKQKEYIVKSGDTLTAIAAAEGVKIQEILDKNPSIVDPNLILVGQKIIIPGRPGEALQISIKGTPLSFPNFDLGAIILGDDIPSVRKSKFDLDVKVLQKNAQEDFFNFKLGNFDF
tara:strand:- start:158 stop:928 length:771 start_codon:yes stop_codon:yes gene_type:complete